MSREDILLSIDELEKKNLELANMQVSLSKDIERMRPILIAAEERLRELNENILVIERRIAEKESQRNEELNIKGEMLEARDSYLNNVHATYTSWEKSLSEKERVLLEETERLSIAKDILEKEKEELANDQSALARELNSYEEKVSNLIADQKRLLDLKVFIDAQQEDIEKEEKRLEAIGKNISEREEAFAEIESLYTQREEYLRKRETDIANSTANFLRIENELKEREDAISARERYSQGEIRIIEEEKKKITLAWLQVNKKIQDKQVDIDLKELQK